MIIYRQFAKPSAITFDLDDTLYDNWPIIRNAETRLLEYLNTEHPRVALRARSEWVRIRKTVIDAQPNLASDMSRLRQAVLSHLGKEVGYSPTQQQMLATLGHSLFYKARSDFKIDKNTYSLLENLGKRVPLVAITNGNVDLQQVGIDHLFSLVFQASIDYPAKPHESMFKAALSKLDIPANRVLHVGDHLIKDIWGAHQCGMQTAWYACNRKMQLNLERVRVLPSLVLDDLNELLLLVN